MLFIAKNEFFKLFKSIKSILIILIFVLASYYTAKFFNGITPLASMSNNESPYYSSLRLLVFIFGYLFISVLSHDCINKEIELQTIRLITSKVSRKDFVLGKFLGITLFWFVCVISSSICIILISKTIEIKIILVMLITCIYFISMVILVSTLVSKSSISNFLGIVLGIGIPLVGLYLMFTENSFLNIFKYLFPYYYVVNMDLSVCVIGIIAAVLLYISYFVLNRKDL